jgi:LuxR family transcriptional regulator, maltose regulon positive regulatory protein
MGEPAAGAATSERDVLLATQANVPGWRPEQVPRPRLAQLLAEGRERGLVLVCAPAGYGKTVLLAEWVRRGRIPWRGCRWMLATTARARFWRHAVAALDRVRPGISDRIGPLLGPPPRRRSSRW